MVMKPDKRLQHRKSIAEVNERRERLLDWLSARPCTGAELELRSKGLGLANSRKTIERDLAFLARENLVVRDERVKPGVWKQTEAAKKTKFKRVSDSIGLLLLQRHFRHVFDQEQLKHLDSAAEALKNRLPGDDDGRWLDRLRILPPGLNMSTVPPSDGVKEALIQAVKRARKVSIVHSRPGKAKFNGTVSVWGLVSRADKLAVIVKPDNAEYPLRLVASWITKADLEDAPEESPPAGVLDKYLAKEEDFDKGRVIKVVLRANKNDADYWEKNRPGEDTEINQEGGAYRVSFKAANLDTLVMFLLSLGSRVEVLEPESVRTKVGDELRLASEQYLTTSGSG